MKKLLDKNLWKYKDGKLHTSGWRSNKHLGNIYYEIDYDPLSLDGKIKFEGVNFPSISTEIEISGGMDEIERVLDKYYEWARSLWDLLPLNEIIQANEIADMARHRVIEKYIKENGGFRYENER